MIFFSAYLLKWVIISEFQLQQPDYLSKLIIKMIENEQKHELHENDNPKKKQTLFL